MLKLFIGKDAAEVKIFKFPAGESGVSFTWDGTRTRTEVGRADITLNWESNDDLINLALLRDAIARKYPKMNVSLTIPYFPYARQDRVCNPGESLSVKVITTFINSLGFDYVYVTDPHSEVLGACLDNMFVMETLHNVRKALGIAMGERSWINAALVSPDAGANKKVGGYARAAMRGGIRTIRADKERDL